MTDLPTYSFLAWLRTGVANTVTGADGDPSVKVRATLALDVTLTGARLGTGTESRVLRRDISLYGPGDVVGVESRAVVKVEPRNWITNFEPNYLPYVEFYDEDFPWRYVPAAADTTKHRLRPWIALMVLRDNEFKDGVDQRGKPLPYLELDGVQATDVLPPAAELWAWAHAHVNADLTNNGDASIPGVLQRLEQTIAANPDRGYARIICPRRLEPDVDYQAFVIPTFETGRLAGLGEDVPAATVATASSWAAGQTRFPYYYRWQFKTGDLGDFEYLVSLLKPRPVDKTVGVRDMDVLHAGPNLPKIDVPAELGGILKLGGALRVPFATLSAPDQQEVTRYDHWDEPYPHPFETAMARRINLADDYTRATAEAVNADDDPDPVVTSPLYGHWHALTERVLLAPDGTQLPDARNWIHRINLDPRYRVAAGLGTRIVQENQERYVNAAWQQVGALIAANNAIRHAQLAEAATWSWYRRHVAALARDRAFVLTAPVHPRIVDKGATVAKQVDASRVPAVLTSAPFRKATRPGTALAKQLDLAPSAAAQILTRVNDGEIVVTPPKRRPQGVNSIEDAAESIAPAGVPPWLARLLDRLPWLPFLLLAVLVVAALLALLLAGPIVALVVAAILAVPILMLFRLLRRWQRGFELSRSIRVDLQTPASVDDLPTVPNFVISHPGSGFTPRAGATDSDEAARFKSALRDVYAYTSIRFDQPVKERLDLPTLSDKVVAAIDPRVTMPRRLQGTVRLPPWIVANLVEQFTPVMAYPTFDEPMYKPLANLSTELFLPHVNLIPPNSLTLLESNQAFIEAYMVGLNSEMGHELLWREYPTDQRGSYFRQFWDASLRLPPNPTPADREPLRDIPEIHLWSRHSALGAHNQRETHGQAALLVLVIRGELLKRYPRAVVYAQKARWHKRPDGTPDATAERELEELTPAEEASLPLAKIRKPLFEAKVDPDITFIGFDLEAKDARGGTRADQDAGWFFVIKERPGEPRFGLDEAPDGEMPRLVNWNNLAWQHLGTPPGDPIQLDRTLALVTFDPEVDQENVPDPEDAQASWRPATNAAEIAYMLYRVPVLIAVHASRMLP